MYLGTIVEEGPTAEIFERPLHPYTEALLAALPLPDPKAQRAKRAIVLEGELPSPLDPPAGRRSDLSDGPPNLTLFSTAWLLPF